MSDEDDKDRRTVLTPAEKKRQALDGQVRVDEHTCLRPSLISELRGCEM
jgi:hypothetical protein